MGSHSYKTHKEKTYYKRYIRQLDSEPTIDERIEFPESDKTDNEFSVSDVPNRRRESTAELISNYVKGNWIPWATGIFLTILVFLMGDAKVDIAKIFVITDGINKSVIKIESDIEKMEEKDHSQDLNIQENKIKTENIENDLESISEK